MRNFRDYIAYVLIFTLVFTSCSKDEASSVIINDNKLVEMNFSTFLKNFDNSLIKDQHASIPNCSNNGLSPNKVVITLRNPDQSLESYEISLVLSNNEYVTHPEQGIKKTPGIYNIEDFLIYSDNSLIWAAPHDGGEFSNYVTDALPVEVVLESGQKNYKEIEVLCYTPENANFFGFLFFEYEIVDVESYCIFVNYCENNIDYPALFSVEVFEYVSDGNNNIKGNQIDISGPIQNQIRDVNEPTASALCVALPKLRNNVTGYWIEVSVHGVDGLYVGPQNNSQYSPILVTPEMVANQDSSDPSQIHHFKIPCLPPVEGCPNGNENPDCSDLPNNCDSAYMFGDKELNNKIDFPNYKGNNWGWALDFDDEKNWIEEFTDNNITYYFPFYAGAGQNDWENRGYQAGNVKVFLGTTIDVSLELFPGVSIEESHIFYSDDGSWPTKRSPGKLGNTYNSDSSLNTHNYNYSNDGDFKLIVHAKVCSNQSDI